MTAFQEVPAYDPDVLRMFVVYERPTDFPGAWPVRCVTLQPGRDLAVQNIVGVLVGAPETLEAARALILPYADQRLPRMAGDDPAIAEVWF